MKELGTMRLRQASPLASVEDYAVESFTGARSGAGRKRTLREENRYSITPGHRRNTRFHRLVRRARAPSRT